MPREVRANVLHVVAVPFLACVCTVLLWGLPEAGLAQTINRESSLKAAFLYQFTMYIRWPDNALATPKTPFVFGILGTDRVGPILRKISQVKDVDGHPIEVRNYSKVEDIRDCHLLFVPRSVEPGRQVEVLKRVRGQSVLIVGETQDFLAWGGVINFAIEQNRIKIRISKSAYEREKLVVSSKLLRVATVVD